MEKLVNGEATPVVKEFVAREYMEDLVSGATPLGGAVLYHPELKPHTDLIRHGISSEREREGVRDRGTRVGLNWEDRVKAYSVVWIRMRMQGLNLRLGRHTEWHPMERVACS